MSTIVHPEDRRELERLDEGIEELLRAVSERQLPIDDAFVTDWVETLRRQGMGLSDQPPRALSTEAISEIRGIILQGIAQQDALKGKILDQLDDAMIRAEQVRHILRVALDADTGVDNDDARALLDQLSLWLPRVPQREIARLADKSTRQVQRWAKDGGVAPRRLQMLARLAALLRYAWTPEGVVAWFDRPRRDLGGRRPLELIDDPTFEHDLIEAARHGRAQHGA